MREISFLFQNYYSIYIDRFDFEEINGSFRFDNANLETKVVHLRRVYSKNYKGFYSDEYKIIYSTL